MVRRDRKWRSIVQQYVMCAVQQVPTSCSTRLWTHGDVLGPPFSRQSSRAITLTPLTIYRLAAGRQSCKDNDSRSFPIFLGPSGMWFRIPEIRRGQGDLLDNRIVAPSTGVPSLLRRENRRQEGWLALPKATRKRLLRMRSVFQLTLPLGNQLFGERRGMVIPDHLGRPERCVFHFCAPGSDCFHPYFLNASGNYGETPSPDVSRGSVWYSDRGYVPCPDAHVKEA